MFDFSSQKEIECKMCVLSSDQVDQTDHRISANKQPHGYAYEDSDFPPHPSNHRQQNALQRHAQNQQGKRNTRQRSLDENRPTRRTSTMSHRSTINSDGATSQMSGQQLTRGRTDAQHRPLWNYQNLAYREYVSNSKRDPHYEKRQRLKHFQQGNYDRIDDVQNKTCYNRWNSDSQLQDRQKKSSSNNHAVSNVSKATSFGQSKDESILNLLKTQNRQPEIYGNRKASSNHMPTDNEHHSNRTTSLEKYENYSSYVPADDGQDPLQNYASVTHTTDLSPQKRTTNVRR
jgi:hypothetical protein